MSAGRGGIRCALAFVLAGAVGTLACDSVGDSIDSLLIDATSIGQDSDPVLATVDESAILASTVDAPLLIELHDLDYAKYRSRRDQLFAEISRRLGKDASPDAWNKRVDIALMPPTPPRFEIPKNDGPTRGNTAAPVTLVEFLDFESPHSRQLQPTLTRILDRYGDRVHLQVRDFPLPYHRHARKAAASAHCAGEQDAYWNFHDMLLLEQPNISPTEVSAFAPRLGLDAPLLETCAATERFANRIDQDLTLASRLGVRRSGTLFVNGLYLSGHPTQDEIERILREELNRLGLDSNPRPESTRSTTAEATAPTASALNAAQSAARDERRAKLPKIPPEMLSEPEAVITLTRAEVNNALEDRDGLDRKLAPSRAEFSGQKLLTLHDLADGDFLTRLGLEEEDVLMIVNGEFVTAEHDWIWDAFQAEDKVSLLIMRQGRPHTYEYRIR